MQVRVLSVTCPAVRVAGQLASAQTSVDLDSQTDVGWAITGAAGAVDSVECVTDPAQTNATGYRVFKEGGPRSWLRGHGCFAGLKTLNLGLVPISSL
jgi:hypothetical protein